MRGSGNYARGEDGRRSTAGAARNKHRPQAKLPAENIQGVDRAKMSVARDLQLPYFNLEVNPIILLDVSNHQDGIVWL